MNKSAVGRAARLARPTNPPHPLLRELAAAYVASARERLDLPAQVVEGHYVPAPTQETGAQIARLYDGMPVLARDQVTRAAYAALAEETAWQYAWLLRYGIALVPWSQDGQPYRDSAEMCADLATHNRLYYFTGGEPHPLLGEANAWLRAVHDCFGHAAEGYSFGPRGEENAWLHHSQMFSPLAQRALTTETRGQNCWVNNGCYRLLPPAERPYAEQKAALLPLWVADWRAVLYGRDERKVSVR